MGLSNELISQFVKATNDNSKIKTEKTVYGTTVVDNGVTYVRLDGSDQLTPISATADTQAGERVIVMLKNHSATIIGNISSPAARVDDIKDYSSAVAKIDEFETVLAKKVSIDDFNAQKARIDSLQSDNVLIRESLTAAEASITDLTTKTADITEKLTANTAEIESLKTGSLTTETADAKYATIANLDATNATVHNLETTFGDFKVLYSRTYSSAANMVVTANGIFGRSTSSSERYENSIVDADISELSGLYDLPVKRFKYNDDHIAAYDELYRKDLYGFNVEDLEDILPCAVQHITGEDGTELPEMWNSNIIVPALLKLIQDLNNRVKILEGKE